ncbi:hypothetical protein FQZ97_788240 [compost metagenome]
MLSIPSGQRHDRLFFFRHGPLVCPGRPAFGEFPHHSRPLHRQCIAAQPADPAGRELLAGPPGHRRLRRRAGRAADHRRAAGRSVRPPPHFPVGHGLVHRVVIDLRAGPRSRDSNWRPRDPGRRGRPADAAGAGLHPRHVRRRQPRAGLRRDGRGAGRGGDHIAACGRVPDRAGLCRPGLAHDIPDQPTHRAGGDAGRPPLHPRDARVRLQPARRRGRPAGGAGPVPAAGAHHAGARPRLALVVVRRSGGGSARAGRLRAL